MLEGLIAILIFSMAILGVVGMQATAIAQGSESQYRADAAFLANQLLAQMWTHAGSGIYVPPPGVAGVSGIISIQTATALGISTAGIAAAPNLGNYVCVNCTIAKATAAGLNAGDPEFVTWLQGIQGSANQPGFLPGVTDTTNMPKIEVGCSATDILAAAALPTPVVCSVATFPASATVVTITLYWQKSTRAPAHQYSTSSDIEPN